MKSIGNWVSFCVVATVLLASCFEPPTYPATPELEFKEVIFRNLPDPSDADSLIVTVKFKDGDGDLGLNSGDTLAPYNNRYYFRFPDGTFITYKTKRTNPNYDTLPAYIKPYNCINWEIRSVNKKLDTFYIQLNPNHYNIFVNFYVQTAGVFTEFDWQKEYGQPNCGIPFHGRFPVLSKDITRKTPLDGTIRYAMKSVGFLLQFSNKPLKLKITIQDRALHKSNTVESIPKEGFTLGGITKSG